MQVGETAETGEENKMGTGKDEVVKTLKEVVEIMDKINPDDTEYQYNRLYFFENDDWYRAILNTVKKLRTS